MVTRDIEHDLEREPAYILGRLEAILVDTPEWSATKKVSLCREIIAEYKALLNAE